MADDLTVTLCGSLGRAAHDLHRVHRAFIRAGWTAYAPTPAHPGETPPSIAEITNITGGHLRAIRRSAWTVGVVPDGVVGDSTRAEIGHAAEHGKTVRLALSPADVDELIAEVRAGRLQRPDYSGACPSCGRADTVLTDGRIPAHDVYGLASPCDAPGHVLVSDAATGAAT
jgi:hypothetical protein